MELISLSTLCLVAIVAELLVIILWGTGLT
jgi:hypothetical protein